jgi:hypothetical protein
MGKQGLLRVLHPKDSSIDARGTLRVSSASVLSGIASSERRHWRHPEGRLPGSRDRKEGNKVGHSFWIRAKSLTDGGISRVSP